MRMRLKGINSLTKKLADGTVKTYWYAWKGGPRIDAEPGTPDFVRLFSEAVAAKPKKSTETFSSLIDYFKDQSEYTGLGYKSKRAYDQYLALVEAKFGAMPIGAVEDRRARGDFKAFRNSFSSTPRKADYVWTTIARVLSVAKDHGKIAVNVCERGGRLYESDRSEIVWTAEDIRAFCGVASIELQAALLLALWTGQRQGDLLRLTWKDYDGTYIRMRQSKGRGSKGRRRVTIPVGPPLKAALDAALKEKRSAVTILVNSFGRPWTEDGFRTSWDKAFKKTSLKDLHFHDLRGTAVTRLALSNCSVPEIAAITGHSMATVQQILDAHYLGGRVELAESAIKKLSVVYG
ncbi:MULTISPECIES: tyrosine-type recombinase/integrase [Bradyrhizobium]|jgi:integrase|uniref:Tyrosine-type recombinase/integrase n=1 Tax=Bradyrhizobium uaiense TaxID=2594946 RepID=A0A6P1BC91_9BRAD|nr:tyrosine-type recombinase/integrase [Bradyrhizobium uaiense]NEU95221.1 tyrosine-type recombinase/integrase [Bradyrhizobium uaiense]